MSEVQKGDLSSLFTAMSLNSHEAAADNSYPITTTDTVSTEDNKANDIEHKKHDLSLQPEGLERAGYIEIANVTDKVVNGEKEKEKKNRQFSDLLNRLDEQRRWLLLAIDQLQIEIDKLTNDIDKHRNKIETLNRFFDDLDKGSIQLDENGYPIEPKFRELAKEFEQRFSKKFDIGDTACIEGLTLMKKEEESEAEVKVEKRSEAYQKQNAFIDLLNRNEELTTKLGNDETLSDKDFNYIEKVAVLIRNDNTAAPQPPSQSQTIAKIDLGLN